VEFGIKSHVMVNNHWRGCAEIKEEVWVALSVHPSPVFVPYPIIEEEQPLLKLPWQAAESCQRHFTHGGHSFRGETPSVPQRTSSTSIKFKHFRRCFSQAKLWDG